tara:strand:- start:718 stop:1008 length:291 start_codon:yes stop_codon:yes gene_type:complete
MNNNFKVGSIVAHYSENDSVINFGVIQDEKPDINDDPLLKVRWTNRDFEPNQSITQSETWIQGADVESIEPFGLIGDLHLAMIEQAKMHFDVADEK